MADADIANLDRADERPHSGRSYLAHSFLSAFLWTQGVITALEFVLTAKHLLSAPSMDVINDPESAFFLPDFKSVIVSDLLGNTLLVVMYAYAVYLLSQRAESFRRFTVFLILFHLVMAIGAITMMAQFDPESVSLRFWRVFDIARAGGVALLLLPLLLFSSRLKATFAPETKY